LIRTSKLKRLPKHVGLIPDGNRRWAEVRGQGKHAGYDAGVEPGIQLLELCRDLGVREVSIYGFTKENVRRPAIQVAAFRQACVAFAQASVRSGHALRVIGDMHSRVFPAELKAYAHRTSGDLRVNLLVNYGWQWDLRNGSSSAAPVGARVLPARFHFASEDVPKLDLIVRWGGRRRLSGFLPIQSAYADIYTLDTLWPDMSPGELVEALHWHEHQDVTMGG